MSSVGPSRPVKPRTPLLFTAGVAHTKNHLDRFKDLFTELELGGFQVYFIGWEGITRISQLENRIVTAVAQLIQIHPHSQIVLGGHSGGAYATVNATASLIAEGLSSRIKGLVLFSLSPWFEPVFRCF